MKPTSARTFETVAVGLNMTRPVRPSTLRNAVDHLAGTRTTYDGWVCPRCGLMLRADVSKCGRCIPEGNDPSISPDAGQNRQMFAPTPTAEETTP